ncbi:uncharacterized protein [Nicotiana sylvestris]|uniref:uncharacterized protein n=1 Tax=Nicotiana sylvestris TaxID=4096 RepID=UPI00388C6AD0
MTRTTFFGAVITFARQIMSDLERLQGDLAHRPVARPNDIPRAPGVKALMPFQYNIDIDPDKNLLSNLKKKSSESFREYAVKWREQAARVKPPMDETEMVSVFLQAQNTDYYQNMMFAMGKPFAETIKIGEMVENGLKTGRILSQSAIRATSQAIQGGSGGVANRKKKEEVAMAISSVRKPRLPRPYFPARTPQHCYPHQDVAYAMVPRPYAVMNAQPYVRPQQQLNQNRAPFPRNQPPRQAQYNPRPPQNSFPYNAHAREPPRMANFTPIGESYSSLFPKLVQMEQKRIVLKDEDVPNVTNNPLPTHNNGPVIGMICKDKEFDPALKAIIAITDVERKTKAVVKQDKGEKKSKPIPQNTEKKVETKTGVAPSKDAVLYVPWGNKKEQMSLSPPRRFELNKGSEMAVVTYKGKEVLGEANETNPAEKYLNLEEVNKATKKRFPLKKPVSAEEAEEFFSKMKMASYEIIDQLRKSPAQVSLLSLLMNSTKHQKVLIKTLNEAKFDLPPEGAAHNKALHLTVKCEGYYVKRVMLDSGSGVDICPLSTLQRMEISTKRIRPNNVYVHAFDGIKRDNICEIDLILTIGPVDFEVTF